MGQNGRTMSERTTAQKLQIKDDYTVYFAGRTDAANLVGELPPGARPVTGAAADCAGSGAAARAELDARTGELAHLTSARAVWVCYPKGNATDVNRDSLRDALAMCDWETVANVSVDATWSAIRVKYIA